MNNRKVATPPRVCIAKMILHSRNSNVAERGVVTNRFAFNLEPKCSNLVGEAVDNIKSSGPISAFFSSEKWKSFRGSVDKI